MNQNKTRLFVNYRHCGRFLRFEEPFLWWCHIHNVHKFSLDIYNNKEFIYQRAVSIDGYLQGWSDKLTKAYLVIYHSHFTKKKIGFDFDFPRNLGIVYVAFTGDLAKWLWRIFGRKISSFAPHLWMSNPPNRIFPRSPEMLLILSFSKRTYMFHIKRIQRWLQGYFIGLRDVSI